MCAGNLDMQLFLVMGRQSKGIPFNYVNICGVYG
jgi:hypothetical protein